MAKGKWSADADLQGASESIRLIPLVFDTAGRGTEPLCEGASDADAIDHAVSTRRDFAPGIATTVEAAFSHGNASPTS